MNRILTILIIASVLLVAPLPLDAQGYGGPSMLSRGGNSPGKRGRAPVNITPYASVRATHETGLLIAALDAEGNLQPQDRQGVQLEYGAYGAKTWRRTSVGLDYRGDYRRYSGARAFDGSNQALSMDGESQLTRRVTLFGRLAAGTTNRAFGGFSAPAVVSGDNLAVPLDELYDNRVYFGQLNSGVAYRASGRLTYRFSGDVFTMKRTGRVLISSQGYRAGADLERVMSRNMTLLSGYSFIHFGFPRIYGSSDIHMVYGGIQRALTRNLNLTARGGIFRLVTLGTQTVELSPEVAAVLGRPRGVEAFRRETFAPQATLSLSYTQERSRLSASYNRSVNPGNGIYITAQSESMSGGYSYSGIRRMSLGVSAGYTRNSSLGLALRDFRSIKGGGGMTYKIADHWGLSLQADRRQFKSLGVLARSGNALSFGLTFTPAGLPISIW